MVKATVMFESAGDTAGFSTTATSAPFALSKTSGVSNGNNAIRASVITLKA